MRKVLIAANGDWENLEISDKVFETSDFIIAVDGGFKGLINFKENLKPDILVGDYDSLNPDRHDTEEVEVKRYSKEIQENETDLQTALREAENLGAEKIIMIGTLGDRLDQSLSSVFLLEKLADSGIRGEIISKKQRAYSVFPGEDLEFETEKGNTISLLPLTEKVEGINTEGLEYKLDRGTLERKETLGISNKAKDNKIRISLDKGVLLITDEGSLN